MKVTVHFISELTGKHRNTVKKHLADLSPDRDDKYDSRRALQLLYVGDNGLTHSEALRRLTITKEQVEQEKKTKLEMENAETRKQLIPIQDVYELLEGCFIAIRERIKIQPLERRRDNDLLLQLHALRDNDLSKLGREALWKEFEAKTIGGPPS